MYGMLNTNMMTFRSKYLIPYKDMEKSDSATLRQFGQETAKCISSPDSMMQTSDSVIVNIDDNKDKEYEAILAKYGLNIQKYDGKFEAQDPMINAYSSMITKLEPENAKAKIADFKNLDEPLKSKEYLKVYSEYKNSPFSIEKQQTLKASDIKPTDAPIIKYVSKDGDNIMAREVVIDGYTCMAVALENKPEQTMLMNKEEFQKFFLDSAKNID